MRRRKILTHAVTIGSGSARSTYILIPKKSGLLTFIQKVLSYEIKLEPDPDNPDNPLAYKIVLIPNERKQKQQQTNNN
ncbi:MAG: hypothetical protein QXT28_06955 [Thermofilaceae archaeon]